MTTIKHSYVSTIPEDAKSGTPGGLVGPTEWNAAHTDSGGNPLNIRTYLTADTTYNVTKAGNDATGDGSVAKPWLTIQHAVDFVVGSVDSNTNQVTIQIGDGTYAEFVYCGCGIIAGKNATDSVDPPFILQGNTSDNTKVIIGPSGASPDGAGILNTVDKGIWWHRFLTIDGTNATGLTAGIYVTGNSFAIVEACNHGSVTGGWLVYGDTLSFVHIFGVGAVTATSAAGLARGDYFATIFFDGNLDFKNSAIAFSDSILYATFSSWIVVRSERFANFGNVTGTRFETHHGSLITDSGNVITPNPAGIPGNTDGVIDGSAWYTGMQGLFLKAGLPVATDVVPGTYFLLKDTSGGGNYLVTNDGGVLVQSTIGNAQARVKVDVTSTSTTLANVTGMSVTLGSSSTYSLETTLLFTDAAAAGTQAAISTTSTGVFTVIYDGYVVDGAGAFATRGYARATSLGTPVASTLTTGTQGQILIRGTITTSAVAGPINVQFAQNTLSASATTIKAGSFMLVQNMP